MRRRNRRTKKMMSYALVVMVNMSRTLLLPQPFASVVVGSPDLVDALSMSDRRLYIRGKKVGTTDVSVFNQSMQLIGVIAIDVRS